MKIKVKLDIGYPTAIHEDILEIDNDLLEGKSEKEVDEIIDKETVEWSWNYINISWERI